MNITTLKEKIKAIDKKWLYLTSVAAAAVILAAGYITFGKENGYADVPKVEDPISASVIMIEPQNVDAVFSAAGALRSKNISLLSSKVMGRVAYLGVNEGDYVSQGKVLLKIESGEISAQAYQAQAAYNNAKLQHDRIKSLYEEKAATRMEMDQAVLGLETARAGLNAAKAMEGYTTIIAPISGQIVEKRINPGEMALPGQPVLKIEDNRSLRLEVTVKEQDIRYLYKGKAVFVRIDAMPEKEFKARVAQVVPAADIRTHSFVVKIDLPSEKGLITGMYGKAYFTTGKREVLLIPRSAVTDMSGISGVYIISPEGNAVFQMVQLGEDHGGNVEALTGLKTGDRMIVNKQNARIEGRKVVLAENGN